MMRPELRGLYAITPEPVDNEALWLAGVAAVLAGGCRVLQYRDKSATPAQRVQRAQVLRTLTRQHGAQLLINDDLPLAFLVAADGVHLGQDDGDLCLARALLGPQRLLGASCYTDFARAEAAWAAGVDYVAFGAVFPSPTKPEAPLAAHSLFSRARAQGMVSCAIGGITLERASALQAAGADLLAVISDVFAAPDVTARAAAYQALYS